MNPTYNPTHSGTTPAEPTLAVELTPADLMRGGARYIQRYGWHQMSMFASDSGEAFPPACAIGGIRAAVTGNPAPGYASCGESPADLRLYERVLAEFAAHLLVNNIAVDAYTADTITDLPRAVIGDWNDEPERTAAEVIQALHDAANEWDRTHNHGGSQ